MKIYNYDPTTGEFVNQSLADPDPLDPNNWLIPAHATTKEPPTVGENQAPVFDVNADAWTTVPDYRGTTFWYDDGTEHEITALGIDLPTGALLEPPEAATNILRASLVTELKDASTFHYAAVQPAPGDEMFIFLEKVKEAQSGSTDPLLVPLIAHEAGLNGTTINALSTEVLNQHETWIEKVKQIKTIIHDAITALDDQSTTMTSDQATAVFDDAVAKIQQVY